MPLTVQWHWNGNHLSTIIADKNDPSKPDDKNGYDWLFSIIATDKQEYIACGYTNPVVNDKLDQTIVPAIVKLNKYGQVLWIKTFETVVGTNSLGPFYLPTNPGGILFTVIQTPNGYAAAGNVLNRTMLVEFDEDGNVLNPNNMVYDITGNSFSLGARTLSISPNGSEYILSGCETGGGAIDRLLHVFKIDRATYTITANVTFGNQNNGSLTGGYLMNSMYKSVVLPNANGYEVVFAGYKSNSALDNVPHEGNTSPFVTDPPNADGSYEELIQKDKEIWFLKVDDGINTIADITYPKSGLSAINPNLSAFGPASARDITLQTFNGVQTPAIGGSLLAGKYLGVSPSSTPSYDNVTEQATDIILTKDGNLAMLVMVNCVLPYFYFNGQGSSIITDVKGVNDNTRNYHYDEYSDGDMYLIKMDLDGNEIWNKYVGHMSSKDFYPKVLQNLYDDDFVIAGSTADYYDITDPGLNTPDRYDALLICTADDDVSDYKWRRNFKDYFENGFCLFGFAGTADGGFVLAGDNGGASGDDEDDFSILKMAPACANFQEYEIGKGQVYTLQSSSETWPNSSVSATAKIAGKVIVENGKTLTIDGCDLQFASPDHIYDYWELDADVSFDQEVGIFVEVGGKLIIKNSTLRGISGCGDRYMWDGIAVRGDPSSPMNPADQGRLIIEENTIIQDARYGILVTDAFRKRITSPVDFLTLGSGNTANDWLTVNTSSRYVGIAGHGGGIVSASFTTFQDCRFGVQFFNANSQFNPGQPYSHEFNNCEFVSTNAGMADPCFYAGPDGQRLPSRTHFGASDVQHLSIKDNVFTCDAGFAKPVRPYGIVLADAAANISRTCDILPLSGNCQNNPGVGNTFSNLYTGVTASYSPGFTARSLKISYNTFDNNYYGAAVSGNTDALKIVSNTFKVPFTDNTPPPAGYPGQERPNGVLLAGNQGYEVRNNAFDKCSSCGTPALGNYSMGVVVKNGHDFTEEVRLNTFNNLLFGAVALQRNGNDASGFDKGLQFRCNDFNDNTSFAISRLSYDLSNNSSLAATLKYNQGVCVTPSSPAGNRFYNPCGLIGGERLYADAQASQVVIYNNNQAGSDYDPDPCYQQPEYTNNPCNNLGNRSHETVCEPAEEGVEGLKYAGAKERYDQAEPNSEEQMAAFAELHLATSAFARYHAFNFHPDSAAAILANEGRYGEAFAFYKDAGMLIEATNALSMMPENTADEIFYKQMCGWALADTSSWRNVSESIKDSLQIIAATNSFVAYLAQAALGNPTFTSINWPIAQEAGGNSPRPSGNKSSASQSGKNDTRFGLLSKESENAAFRIYPNPTNSQFTVSTLEAGTLNVFSIDGRAIATYVIRTGQNVGKMPSNVSGGVYILQFKPSSGAVGHIVKLVYQAK